MANAGRRAFSRLFEEVVSNISFQMVLKGEERTLTQPEILNQAWSRRLALRIK